VAQEERQGFGESGKVAQEERFGEGESLLGTPMFCSWGSSSESEFIWNSGGTTLLHSRVQIT
jgi:hypothetical protein